MRLRNLVMGLTLAVVGIGVAAPAAHAQYYERYRVFRYYHGRETREIHRRDVLHDRLVDLGDRVRLAEREGDISRHRADELYDRLDRVRDLLIHDHYINLDEFDRWMRHLDHVADDLRDALPRRRYEDRYYRDDDRYRR